ncbi:MAG: hybrid sensor histidine kinase/response regulator [Sulfurimonas sp.]|nr:MAG: hybrid sensor histidine kinase/response regulator [Sulfurimonas sp.]
MELGLKNRLKLISLLPIIVLFTISSYLVYSSYVQYKEAQQLQIKLEENKLLNEVVGNLARERGMSAMYLGGKTEHLLESLNKQRKIIDKKIENYIKSAKQNETLNLENFITSMRKIKDTRALIDNHTIEFEEMFMDIYSATQKKLIKHLEELSQNQRDKEIGELYSLYISMVYAKEASGVERGYMSYIISSSTHLIGRDLNNWFSIIAKADSLNYEGIQNKELVQKLDVIFKTKKNQELSDDINSQRTAIIALANSGKYEISSEVWFKMLSDKISIISEAEDLLLNAIDIRAEEVQKESLQMLSIILGIWLIAIILAALGYILSNEIANNIKHLESILKKVAQDYDSQDRKINLQTVQGTDLAYALLEEIIEQTKKDKISAQEASEAKSMFLANMSHEIRTPLNGIVGFTELLKDSGLQEEQSEFVDIIEKSSENLLEIINNILDLSKIESNKLEIENIAFNPVVEFESAVEVYAVRASEKNINLGCFIDPSLEFPLKGDPTKLKEVIINLLSNAVKFTNNAGSIDVNIRRVESGEIAKARIKFEIQDNGIGVSEEQKSRIFEAFSQADTSITRKYGGTGLGLTISSSFINLMGGKLDLDSKIGEGTTFFFTLDFDEVETLTEGYKDSFNNLKALILSDPLKIKKQDKYLREYLDYFCIGYTTFKDINKINSLQKDINYNLLFVDYDYVDDKALEELSKLSPELIVLTKSNLMKKVDALGLDIFKILYEPLHVSKIKQMLENYISANASIQVLKKQPHKKFDLNTSRFVANVLVAEDNIINQKLIKRTLEDLGLTVTIANNGLDAFQKRKNGNFDMIFMDIQMPFLDGVEATAEILEWEEDYDRPHVPIVALTANALKGDRERFLLAGLDEYTTKPLVRSEIISVLNKFFANHIIDVSDLTKIANDKKEQNSTDAIQEAIIEKLAETVENPSKPLYRADILIAKKSDFETRLYTKIIEGIGLTELSHLILIDMLSKTTVSRA